MRTDLGHERDQCTVMVRGRDKKMGAQIPPAEVRSRSRFVSDSLGPALRTQLGSFANPITRKGKESG